LLFIIVFVIFAKTATNTNKKRTALWWKRHFISQQYKRGEDYGYKSFKKNNGTTRNNHSGGSRPILRFPSSIGNNQWKAKRDNADRVWQCAKKCKSL
jgi:hypothetical protein